MEYLRKASSQISAKAQNFKSSRQHDFEQKFKINNESGQKYSDRLRDAGIQVERDLLFVCLNGICGGHELENLYCILEC
jgi:hypothetical protein